MRQNIKLPVDSDRKMAVEDVISLIKTGKYSFDHDTFNLQNLSPAHKIEIKMTKIARVQIINNQNQIEHYILYKFHYVNIL